MANAFSFDETGVVLEKNIPRAPAATPDGASSRRAGGSQPGRTKHEPAAKDAKAARSAKAAKPTAAPRPERGSTNRRGVRAAIPWVLLAGALGGGAAAALWGYHRYGLLDDALARSGEENRALVDRTTRLEGEVAALGSALLGARAELATSRITRTAESSSLADAARGLGAAVAGAAEGAVTSAPDRVTLELADDLMFAPGDDQLTDRGRVVLLDVGEALNRAPAAEVRIHGHADPIATPEPGARFASSWELSSARALTVVRYLQTDALVDPGRMAAVAFGEHRAGAVEGRAHRRTEIVLLAPAAAAGDAAPAGNAVSAAPKRASAGTPASAGRRGR